MNAAVTKADHDSQDTPRRRGPTSYHSSADEDALRGRQQLQLGQGVQILAVNEQVVQVEADQGGGGVAQHLTRDVVHNGDLNTE